MTDRTTPGGAPAAEHAVRPAAANARRWMPDGFPPDGVTPLFLLPPAGGSAAMFGGPAGDCWADALPPGYRACPVDFPGHGRQMTTSRPLSDMARLVSALDAACRPADGRPWVLLGHSMGALTAAAWAQAAHAVGHGPELLILSAAAAPWHTPAALALSAADDGTLWRTLSELGGVPTELAASSVARRLLTRVMRADIETAASYTRRPPPRRGAVGCPVVAVVGREDPAVRVEQVDAWRNVADGGFTLVRPEGGHFYREGLADLAPVAAAALST
ncbi:thioesterase II family protein [Streptomyces sp. NPDC055400]